MSAKFKLAIVVVLLVVMGSSIAAYKSLGLGVPFWIGKQVHDWQIEAKVTFFVPPAPTAGKPIDARLTLPPFISDQASAESGALGYELVIDRAQGAPRAVWSGRDREGQQALYFRVRVAESVSGNTGPLAGEMVEPEIVGFPGSLSAVAEGIIQRVKDQSSNPDLLVVSVMKEVYQDPGTQELVLLKRHYEKNYKTQGRVMLIKDLLNAAGVPARLAFGLQLIDDSGVQSPILLIEYYDGVYWKLRDPEAPTAFLDDHKVFVWHRGGGSLLDVTGGESSKVVFTVDRQRISQDSLTDLKDSSLLVSTILGLPMAERAVFRYLVLIPLGAFIVVVLRNIVGVPTSGTFMPVLIALALLEIPLARGLIMFSVLVAVGLWFRFLLSRLNLLVVPRVAACVVIVTLLMMVMSVVSYAFGVGGGIQITLFPMIILAWTIERMSLIWEEEGKRSALIQVGGSLLVSVLAYLFMKVAQIQYWAFYFPELLLVLLAGILMIGRYTGYRISELFRFKSFPEPRSP